jgi:hypothetical protein
MAVASSEDRKLYQLVGWSQAMLNLSHPRFGKTDSENSIIAAIDGLSGGCLMDGVVAVIPGIRGGR